MIYLNAPTTATAMSIQMDLSGAVSSVEPECHASYREELAQAPIESHLGYKPTSGATQRSVTSGATDVVVCAAPQVGTVRAVESIIFNNRDTAAVTVRIWTDDGTDERELFGPRSVNAGELVVYEHGRGWDII